MVANATLSVTPDVEISDQTEAEVQVPAGGFSRAALRSFHISGRGLEQTMPAGALRPVAFESLTGLTELESHFPLCVAPEKAPQALRELTGELEHAGIITSAFRTAMDHASAVRFADATPAAMASLVECSPAEIGRLRKLPAEGAQLLGFQAAALPSLHAAILVEARRKQREQFLGELRRASARLRELLAIDETHGGATISAESISGSLGAGAGSFFNTGHLAEVLQRRTNPLRKMARDRRARCEAALVTLEKALLDAGKEPAFWVFTSGGSGFEAILAGGIERETPDSFSAALEFCNARLEQFTQILRALRAARLEMESAYNPAIHDEMLERFDWRAAKPEELGFLAPVVVLETAERAAEASLTSFGRLLRSGRPIQVMISCPGLASDELSGVRPDFAYLAIAHREAFVLQASMASPAHLVRGLAEMAKTLRPAVAVVAVPPERESETQAWLEASVLVQSRTFPLYVYNPDSGAHWTERFQLQAGKAEAAGLTAVHAAAASDEFRQHFRLIPPAAWENEQLELTAYLEAYTERPPLAIPYLWVAGPNGTQQRAAITRDLVNFCMDRRRAWTLFEDLASVGKPQPVANDEARRAGAKEAIDRVLALLAAR